MDLLYSKYASPLDFMDIYIEQGRFGEFVFNILSLENKKKQEEAEKENEHKLWMMYVHSGVEVSFIQWKEQVLQSKDDDNYAMSDEQVDGVKQQARGILKSFSPK